jgi:hypothetical protein
MGQRQEAKNNGPSWPLRVPWALTQGGGNGP